MTFRPPKMHKFPVHNGIENYVFADAKSAYFWNPQSHRKVCLCGLQKHNLFETTKTYFLMSHVASAYCTFGICIDYTFVCLCGRFFNAALSCPHFARVATWTTILLVCGLKLLYGYFI